MTLPLRRVSLLWKILLATSVAITVPFALTGWIVVKSAIRATSESVNHEVQASFHAYRSLWQSRADRLSSISTILATMSDVRAAFGTGDEATIRDTAAELWSRVSDENAIFLVTKPRGEVIASLGGASSLMLPEDLPVVRQASPGFPKQASGFLVRENRLFHLTITPVYVQAGSGNALIDVLVAGYDVNRAVAERLKEATGGSEFLFLSNGRVIASTLSEAVAARVGRELRQHGNAPVRAGDSEYAPLITPLVDVSGTPVGQLAILRSFDAAYAQMASLRRNIIFLWLLSMGAGFGLSYVLARRVVEPVKELDRAATEVARQNYDCELPVRSQDELGRLASTFNAMCASIREAREELIRSERIATIGRLTGSIVHDLRNPLAAIYGGTEMLMDGRLSPPQVQRLARNMYRSSQQIQGLLQDLLNVCRGKAEELELCDLRGVANSAAEALSALAHSQSVNISIEVPEGLEVMLERHRIERVFINLVGNAIEAMPEGGAITIRAVQEDGSVRVEIHDTGPGIAPEIRGRLFQPFVTARKRSGLGLGLALARQAVMDHGGDMWVDSRSGGGACFCFRLPTHLVSEPRLRASSA